MQPVYFAHGYREREAPFAAFFGKLLRKQRLLPSLDPPSESVNAAKLERHLRYTKGLVAIVSSRDGGVSPHIQFEISMSIRLGLPLLVFFEDTLPPELLPKQIPKIRFSASSFVRETREHLHAISNLADYIGRENIPKFVSPNDRRTCLLIGFGRGSTPFHEPIKNLIASKGYEAIETPLTGVRPPIDDCVLADVRSADLAIAFIDEMEHSSMFFLGLSQSCMVPTILLTTQRDHPLNTKIPEEYQRVFLNRKKVGDGILNIIQQVDLFEEDFVNLDRDSEAETYADQLTNISSTAGEYTEETRSMIIKELTMGDKYTTGQAGAVGPASSSTGNTINHIWQQNSDKVDLPALAVELDQLRKAMKRADATADQDAALGAVASAQAAAEKGDGPGALSHLKIAGKRSLDAAKEIGVGVAIAAIMSATTL